MIKKKAFNKSIITITILVLVFVFFSIYFSIQFFSKRELKQIWADEIKARINCHTVSNSGELVCLGTDTGFCYMYDQTGKKVFEKKFPFPILDLKFSYDQALLYVKGSSLFAINLSNQKVVWEKVKKNYLVEDFWIFRDGKAGILFRASKDITLVYQYLDKFGQTLKENTLSDIFGRFSCYPSSDGKYFLISQIEGDLYLYQSDGIVVWNIHLDPPVKDNKEQYPILQSVTKSGSVFLAYTGEEYGKDLNITLQIDNKSNTIWKSNQTSPISGILLSPDEKKLLITTENKFIVYEIADKTLNILYSLDQYGYKPSITRLGTTNVLVGFVSTDSPIDTGKSSLVYKLISLNQNKVLWQKRSTTDVFDFSVVNKGYVFVETTPHRIMYYRYVLH